MSEEDSDQSTTTDNGGDDAAKGGKPSLLDGFIFLNGISCCEYPIFFYWFGVFIFSPSDGLHVNNLIHDDNRGYWIDIVHIKTVGTGVYLFVESIKGDSFGFGEIMGLILGLQLCIASLAVCIQTYYIMQASKLHDTINSMHDEVVRTSALVETLKIHKEYLESETDELKDFRMALNDFMTEQELNEDDFERLMRESRHINMKVQV